MRIAFGLKAHSGWAALVAVGYERKVLRVVDRRRIELVSERDPDWPGQPYHAAEGKPSAQARRIVEHGIADARACAQTQLRAALARATQHEIAACAVLTPTPLPDWTLEQILAVHLRMHQAEGTLYPDALLRAARKCELRAVAVAQKSLQPLVQSALRVSFETALDQVAALGKSVGAPWGADQKQAALAAMIALREPDSKRPAAASSHSA